MNEMVSEQPGNKSNNSNLITSVCSFHMFIYKHKHDHFSANNAEDMLKNA